MVWNGIARHGIAWHKLPPAAAPQCRSMEGIAYSTPLIYRPIPSALSSPPPSSPTSLTLQDNPTIPAAVAVATATILIHIFKKEGKNRSHLFLPLPPALSLYPTPLLNNYVAPSFCLSPPASVTADTPLLGTFSTDSKIPRHCCFPLLPHTHIHVHTWTYMCTYNTHTSHMLKPQY